MTNDAYRAADAAMTEALARVVAAHQRFIELNHDSSGTIDAAIKGVRATLEGLVAGQQVLKRKQTIMEEQAMALQAMITALQQLRDARRDDTEDRS